MSPKPVNPAIPRRVPAAADPASAAAVTDQGRPYEAGTEGGAVDTVASSAGAAKAAKTSDPASLHLAPVAPDLARGMGRIPVVKVEPVIEGGAYPAKAVVGELLPISARVFREGHDNVNASVILTAPDGTESRHDMTQIAPTGLDIWQVWVRPDVEGAWTFRVEGWSDPWGTWLHHAEAKLPVGVDVELVCLEGREVLEQGAAAAAKDGNKVDSALLTAVATTLIPERDNAELLESVNQTGIRRAMRAYGPRELVSPTADFPLYVDRRKALFSSWYEFFPRSQGATFDGEKWTSGTFDSSHERLEAAAAMGFDVVYLPPIHPIGTQFRKGKNNSLTPSEQDPGSPWAIGNTEGGHDAIHPELGDFDSFDRFVTKAKGLGLEIALDFALQASPDHPWVTEHPEWFTTRLDGTIAYAENPPKKYQDIYPINFDNDPVGIYHECLRLLNFWIDKGVTIFRVDNPHTKPVQFWAWLLAEVRKTHPEVLFLAEAFTRPEMMHALGKIGFHQSYTYFTWRNDKEELVEYLTELSKDMAAFYRPNFFVNTPDINPGFLQSGRPSAFVIRAILAATMSPSWGVYSGYELCEHLPFRQGGEEYLDSEKYEFRPRDYDAPGNLNMLLGSLNAIRKAHPALQQLRNITFHTTTDRDVICYSKWDGDDRIIVVCLLDPHNQHESDVYLDMDGLGLRPDDVINVHDELGGAEWTWGSHAFVRLTPANPAHVLHVRGVRH